MTERIVVDVRGVDVGPNDIVLATVDHQMGPDTAAQIASQVKAVFPDNKVVVIVDAKTRLDVLDANGCLKPAPTAPIGPTEHLDTVEYWRELYCTAVEVGQETIEERNRLRKALEAIALGRCDGHLHHPAGSPPCPYRTPTAYARAVLAGD